METKLPITIEPDRTKLHNILSASTISIQDIISFYDIVEKYNLHDRFSVYTCPYEDYMTAFKIKYDNLSSIYRFDTSLYSDFNCYNKLYERTTSDINNFLNPNGRQEIMSLYGIDIDFNIKLSKSDFMRKFIYAINFLIDSYFKIIKYYNNQKENTIAKHNQYMNYKFEYILDYNFNEIIIINLISEKLKKTLQLDENYFKETILKERHYKNLDEWLDRIRYIKRQIQKYEIDLNYIKDNYLEYCL